jgi:hypothetical protein
MNVWGARVVTASVVAIAAALVVHNGGGAESRTPPPIGPREKTQPAKEAEARGAQANEVYLRLVDALKDARIEAPSLRAGKAALAAHWRKMSTPWTDLPPGAAELAVNIALLTSASEE